MPYATQITSFILPQHKSPSSVKGKEEKTQQLEKVEASFLTDALINKSFAKTAKMTDEVFALFPIILGGSAEDMKQVQLLREPLEELERIIYLMDKIVEEGQRLDLPWDIDILLQAYNSRLQELGIEIGATPLLRQFVEHIPTYFELETNILKSERAVDLATVRKIWSYRSNDVRILIVVMMCLMGKYSQFESDHSLHTTLDTIFKLAELAMDARDYVDDVADDSFNTFRQFSHLYGLEKACDLLHKEMESVRAQFEAAVVHLKSEEQKKAAKASYDQWMMMLQRCDVKLVSEVKDLSAMAQPYDTLAKRVEDNQKWIDRKHTADVAMA